MRNFKLPGHLLTLTAPYTVVSGGGALVDALFGIATTDVVVGQVGEFMVCGVFELPKTSAQAWSQGQLIYWDTVNRRCDSAAVVGPEIGTAIEPALNPSGTGLVRLNGIGTSRDELVEGEASPAPISDATAGNRNLTAAEVLAKIYVRDCAGAGRTDTLPSAAALVAALPGAKVGDVLQLYIVNGSDAAENLTLATGAGGSFDVNQTAASRIVAQNASKLVHVRLTNVGAGTEAYVVYA